MFSTNPFNNPLNNMLTTVINGKINEEMLKQSVANQKGRSGSASRSTSTSTTTPPPNKSAAEINKIVTFHPTAQPLKVREFADLLASTEGRNVVFSRFVCPNQICGHTLFSIRQFGLELWKWKYESNPSHFRFAYRTGLMFVSSAECSLSDGNAWHCAIKTGIELTFGGKATIKGAGTGTGGGPIHIDLTPLVTECKP
jgi:hypothetical protein